MTQLFPSAYEKLIEEDITWLMNNSEHSLEREHIICVLRHAIKEYADRGYMEAMRSSAARRTSQ